MNFTIKNNRIQIVLFIIAPIFFIISIGYIEFYKYSNYISGYKFIHADYALINEVLHNIFTKANFYNNLDLRSTLGEHFIFILSVIAPVKLFGSGLPVYIIFDIFYFILCYFVLYNLSFIYLKNKNLSYLISILFLFYPPLSFLMTSSANTEKYCILPFLAAIYCLKKNKYFAVIFFLIIAGLVKENYFIASALFGFFFLNNNLKKSISIFLIASVFFIIIIFYFIPHYNFADISVEDEIYAHLGSTQTGIAVNLIKHPLTIINLIINSFNLKFFIMMFLPLIGLSLICPILLIPLIPHFIYTNLSGNPAHNDYHLYYHSIYIPFIFWSSIKAIENIRTKTTIFNNKATALIFLTILTVTSAGFYIYDNPLFYLKKYFPVKPFAEKDKLDKAINMIKPGASVSCSLRSALHLKNNSFDYFNGIKLKSKGYDYVLYFFPVETVKSEKIFPLLQHLYELVRHEKYNPVYYSDNVYLLKKVNSEYNPEPDFISCLNEMTKKIKNKYHTGMHLKSPVIENMINWRNKTDIYIKKPYLLDIDFFSYFIDNKLNFKNAYYILNDNLSSKTFIFNTERSRFVKDWQVNEKYLINGQNKITITAGLINNDTLNLTTLFNVDLIPPKIFINKKEYGPFKENPGKIIDVDFYDDNSILWWYDINGSMGDKIFKMSEGFYRQHTLKKYTRNWKIKYWDKLTTGPNTINLHVLDVSNNYTKNSIIVLRGRCLTY